MKKKDKNKETAMPEFKFKEFTAEENRIYAETIGIFRETIAAGKTLKETYESCSVADEDLRSLIQADFLKILIAERHFGLGRSVDEVAKDLAISTDLIQDTKKRMLQEVGTTAADQFGQEHGSLAPKSDD